MNSLVSVVVLACLFLAQSIGSPVSENVAYATTSFSVNLLKELLEGNPNNVVVSPVSLSTLLAIVQQGSEGETQTQLTKVLGTDPNESKQGYSELVRNLRVVSGNETLEFANGAFLNEGFDVKPSFQDTLVNDFQADIETVAFSEPEDAAGKINAWVSNHTHGRIEELVTPDQFTSGTRLVLTNAIYFNDLWETPFDKADTTNDVFYLTSSESVTVPTMHLKKKSFKSGSVVELDSEWVALPFEGGRFNLLVILPNSKDGIDTLVNGINAAILSDIISSLNITIASKINLALPKFKLISDLELVPALKQLGLVDIFDLNAQLGGISDSDLFVSDIVQKAEIEVDEKGATASAATGVIVGITAVLHTPEFIVDHQFLAFIVDGDNNLPLFAAKVADPSKS